MENLELKTTKKARGSFSPDVRLDTLSGQCQISGRSLMSNPQKFYQPIFDWVKKYISKNKSSLQWDIRVDYFNSSSKKAFILLFKQLNQFRRNGGNLEVNWYYISEDTDFREEIEDICLVSELEINILSKDLSFFIANT